MPCFRHRSLADIPAACSFKTLMICSSVNLLLRIVRLLGGEQNPNSKSGAFQGSRSRCIYSGSSLISTLLGAEALRIKLGSEKGGGDRRYLTQPRGPGT